MNEQLETAKLETDNTCLRKIVARDYKSCAYWTAFYGCTKCSFYLPLSTEYRRQLTEKMKSLDAFDVSYEDNDKETYDFTLAITQVIRLGDCGLGIAHSIKQDIIKAIAKVLLYHEQGVKEYPCRFKVEKGMANTHCLHWTTPEAGCVCMTAKYPVDCPFNYTDRPARDSDYMLTND